jgi:hypothetical protein
MKRAADEDISGFRYGKEIPGQGFEIYEVPNNNDVSSFNYGLVPSMSRVHVYFLDGHREGDH